ncbi:MAG: DUF4340 domain-containing protein [Candidatus Latescibacterota bacterium]|nr:MAG: DUF4340 domain-containing protein [Candidatus Latescibacterota bacterium]
MMNRSPAILAAVFLVLVGGIVLFVVSGKGGPAKRAADADALYPDLDTSRVDRIEIRTRRGGADLFRDGPIWRAASEDSFPADPDAVGKLLETALGFEASEIASRNASKHEIFAVDSASAIEVRLLSGAETDARFFVGKSGSDFQSTYVRDARGPDVYRQVGALKSVFDRGSRTWKDKAIFRLDEAEMVSVELDRKGEIIRYESRGEGGWVVVKPEGHRGVGALAPAIVMGLTKLGAIDYAPAGDDSVAGVDPPEATVRIGLRGGDEKALLIGAEKAGGGGRYVKRTSDGVLFLVPSSRVVNYLRPASELIEPAPPDSGLAIPPGAGEGPSAEGSSGGE